MAFAVVCKSCQARFLLNDDLLRRKVAGRVVTVRCRQCHATIEVDASDVDPKRVAEDDRSQPFAASPPPPPAPTSLKPKAPKPAPAPPRPAAKSTLMGIGAPKPPGATELVALSPGLLSVGSAAQATRLAPQGFPEPPPPPGVMELLDAGDWEITDTPILARAEVAPERVDDFIEELAASVTAPEELPSATGTPSLKALTHQELHALGKPRVDDFLANMNAATNGGVMTGAPTIDVSQLASASTESSATRDIDVSDFDVPLGSKKTLPLFELPPGSQQARPVAPLDASIPAGRPQPPTGRGHTQPLQRKEALLVAPAVETAPVSGKADSRRERRNVVPPATKSVPPSAPERQRSYLAAPLLLALAAAAGFLIWKRGATPPSANAVTRPEQEVTMPAAAQEPTAVAPIAAAPAASEQAAAPATPIADDMTFETVKAPVAQAPEGKPSSASSEPAVPSVTEPKASAVAKQEPEPAVAREPAAEPSGPFDRAAAAAALTASAAQASACRKEGDPSGVASVVMSFAPSGRVTSANISGPPFAGTPTGGCIASALRKTRIPAFEGDRVTVSKTIVIQ